MLSASKRIWLIVISSIFVFVNGYFIYKEQFIFLGFPFIILIGYLALYKMDLLLKIVLFFVPLSVSLRALDLDKKAGLDMSLPTEPILFGLLILFIIKLFQGKAIDKNILRHPVTVAIIFNAAWILLTCITSTHPMISLKFLLSRVWLLVGFYFLLVELFKRSKNISQFFWLYLAGFLIVIIYTIVSHSGYNFDQESANWIMNPFFNDHTSYGAALAFVLPFLTYQLFSREIIGTKKLLVMLLYLIVLVALVLSYTRAAWVSVLGAFMVYLVLKLKIKWWVITAFTLLIAVVLIGSWTRISLVLESNKQDSSTDLKEHVSSISNVSSDASNLERLNRWKSAYEMFKVNPVFGWGPGVYAFEYAPFQRSYDKTIISTNAGDGGNAHSEYLGPLSETGILGSLSFIAIILTTTISAVKTYKNAASKRIKNLVLVAFLGLVSYYIHGILNNFLDTDKISSLFWGMTAVIVVADIYFKKMTDQELDQSNDYVG